MMTIGIGTQTPEQALASLSNMTKTLVPIQPEEYFTRIANAQEYMQANNIDAVYLNALARNNKIINFISSLTQAQHNQTDHQIILSQSNQWNCICLGLLYPSSSPIWLHAHHQKVFHS